MWTYSQSTGQIAHNGTKSGVGYSGNGLGLDNPGMQDIADVGPIPQGLWSIGKPFTDPEKGPIVMALTADPATTLFGRSGFLIHGDNEKMDHTASKGCIILSHDIRTTIAASPDHQLTVTL
jgi:hypothetical protein